MTIYRKIFTVLALLSVALLTQGHSGEHHDHDAKGAKHGGQFVEVEGHHGVEMVTAEKTVVFHLSEDHEPMDVTGGTFQAVVQTAEATTIVPLTVSGATATGDLATPLPKGAKIAFSGKDATGHAIQARFVME